MYTSNARLVPREPDSDDISMPRFADISFFTNSAEIAQLIDIPELTFYFWYVGFFLYFFFQ